MSSALASKMVKVMGAVGFIPKSGYNEAQRYNYVTDADVLNTLRLELAKQGVATVVNVADVVSVPFVTAKGSPMFLVTVQGDVTLIDAETGEREVALMAGAGSDSTDKGIYKAITGAVKYALLKTFLVPTGDDPERDEPNEGGSGSKAQAAERATTTRSSGGLAGNAAARDVSPTSQAGTSSEPHAGSDKPGLTDPQRRMLKARMTSKGLKGPQQTAFAMLSVGKPHSNQMDNADLDRLLAALEDDQLVAQVIDEVVAEAKP